MQSMQRKFGKLLNRAPGDNAKVSVLLSDYEDADRVLAKVIDSSIPSLSIVQFLGVNANIFPSALQIIESNKSWQESWNNLVDSQLDIADIYAQLYDPIVGATDGHGRDPVRTSDRQLQQTFALKEAYTEVRSELMEEINSIETRILRPALEARKLIDPIRKTVKKRENKRLDLEKCQDKVHKLHRKSPRTPKEDAQLSKAEEDLANLNEVRLLARPFRWAGRLC